ncbi:MAG: hypothetical protein IJB16_02550, partial [Clostridia bacterium]|nr:hypothetical protein [Clostridia bacterium]
YKKLVAILLVLCMIMAFVPSAFADGTTAKLYTFFGDGMLFKQNEEAVITGTAEAGSKITAELYNAENALVASGETDALHDGTFAVSFMSPAGGYDEYTVVLKCNNAEFEKLENIVFGELWIANGQSNMQYPLAQAKRGREMFARQEKLSEWLRVLLVPAIPEYKGSTELAPADPQKDIPGAQWVTGENPAVYSMSAVAYFFAEELLEELDMPVGVLNVSLGGTSIASWISRGAIDGDTQVKNDFVSSGDYIEKSDWDEKNYNISVDMTINYNLKMEALKNFRVSGMIWYQGESDIMMGWSGERYARAFDLMQRSYTELYEYKDGLMPIIYTQLAPYYYSDEGYNLTDMNIAFTDIQKQRPESRAVVSVNDIPVTFIPEAGLIHPESKEEISDRMAYAAMGLVYGEYETYTAPTLKNAEIKEGSIYVSFNNIGNGVKSKGDTVYGFALCGKDGVYVQANAEIIAENSVRIWSENVAEPCSASYAYCVSNQRANLYATDENGFAMPVSPFVTDKNYNTHFYKDKIWVDCEDEFIWHTETDALSNFYSSWTGENVVLSAAENDAFSGTKGMNIKATDKSFSVSPIVTYQDGNNVEPFFDTDTDYSDYSEMSFYVKNNGENEAVFEGVKFTKDSVFWYTAFSGEVIPADGAWHKITVNLNRVHLFGNECGFGYTNERLDNVVNIEFMFTSLSDNSDIGFDCVRFTPSTEKVSAGFDADVADADNAFEFVSALFVRFIGLFANLFS